MKYLILTTLIALSSFADNRLKDLITIKGVRDNPLVGYGLVVGLNGTGDSGGEITNQSLKKMFGSLGLRQINEVNSANVAAVIVTAKLPPFGRIGQKLDITVSSIGDAKSLAGGTLLVTPLKGGDGKVYAVANGALSIGGLEAGKKFATSGQIPDGGTVEKELKLDFSSKRSIRLALKRPDFTTAARIAKTINENLGGKYATASDSATIDLIIPFNYSRKIVDMIAVVENFRVNQDHHAKIVINEKTGTIVAGGEITLKKVAVSHKGLMIQVGGEKKTLKDGIFLINEKSNLNDLVKAP